MLYASVVVLFTFRFVRVITSKASLLTVDCSISVLGPTTHAPNDPHCCNALWEFETSKQRIVGCITAGENNLVIGQRNNFCHVCTAYLSARSLFNLINGLITFAFMRKLAIAWSICVNPNYVDTQSCIVFSVSAVPKLKTIVFKIHFTLIVLLG